MNYVGQVVQADVATTGPVAPDGRSISYDVAHADHPLEVVLGCRDQLAVLEARRRRLSAHRRRGSTESRSRDVGGSGRWSVLVGRRANAHTTR